MKITTKIKGHKREFPDLTFEEIKQVVKYMNEGKTEEEALELVKHGK